MKRKEEKRKGNRIKERVKSEKLKVVQLSNTFSKRKSIAVKLEEEGKVCNWVPSWVPIIVVSSALIKNMMPWFNRIEVT